MIGTNIEIMISEEEIQNRVSELAEKISKDYEGKELHVVGVLRGGVFFTTDLAKKITLPITMDFIMASSYGNATVTSGEVKIIKDLEEDICGRDVLIIEDMIDSGITLSKLVNILKSRNPASLKICTMFDKQERRQAKVDVEYIGFKIPDKFLVGYGLDYQQKYRNLPYVGVVKE